MCLHFDLVNLTGNHPCVWCCFTQRRPQFIASFIPIVVSTILYAQSNTWGQCLCLTDKTDHRTFLLLIAPTPKPHYPAKQNGLLFAFSSVNIFPDLSRRGWPDYSGMPGGGGPASIGWRTITSSLYSHARNLLLQSWATWAATFLYN